MSPRRASVVAWVLTAGAAGLMVIGAAVGEVTGADTDGNPLIEDVLLLVAFVAFPIIGALAVSRDSRNGLAWMFIGIGLSIAVLVSSSTYSEYAIGELGQRHGLAVFAAWLAGWTWFPAIGAIPTFIPLLFPSGHLPSRRWRYVAWLSLAAIAPFVIASMFEARLEGETYSIANPVGVWFITDAEEQLGATMLVLPVAALLSFASLIVRFVKASDVERLQIKWVAAAAAVLVVAIVLEENITSLPPIVFPVTLLLIPLSIGVAMLRYRLYEIDLIINRALVYGSLSALLAGGYVGIVFALQATPLLNAESDIAIAASTLLVAALFRPLRSRIQDFIDRRFYRRKFDAQRTVDDFSAHLRDEVELPAVTDELMEVVRETMQPAHVSLWLRQAVTR